jgi:2TM domain
MSTGVGTGKGTIMDPKREEALRRVRKKRTFYIVLVVYAALVALWFLIDVLTGSDDWWFYWPMLGAGVIVLIIGLSMFGLSGLFGQAWQQRQMDRYMSHSGPDNEKKTPPPPPPGTGSVGSGP